MNTKLSSTIQKNTISLEEFSKDFFEEQQKIVQNEMRFYDVLMTLKETRKKIGLTQGELAEKANIPRTTVTKIESGRYNPTLSTLMSLASAMDKTLQIKVV